MCILCKNKKNEIPEVDVDILIQQDVDRDGLSNIYNIGNQVGVCNEVFMDPLYYMDGTIKPTTGYTTTACSGYTTGDTYSVSGCSAVYNLSEIDDFDITFNITGNTAYTGYTGQFCYHTFDLFNLGQDIDYITQFDSVISNCFDYSGITGNTIVDTIGVDKLPYADAQYFIQDYNKFFTQECPTKLLINTFDLTTQFTADTYSNGWYFVTTINPESATITQNDNIDLSDNAVLRTENIELFEGMTSVFTIKGTPLNNEMIVHVNGIQLLNGVDWEAISGQTGAFEILTGELEPTKDILTVTYLTLINQASLGDIDVGSEFPDIYNLNEIYLKLDSFIVDSITTGTTTATTITSTPIVNYNPTKNRQEILLTAPIRSLSSIIFVVNGVRLTKNIDYYISRTDNRKLILDVNTIIKLDDDISIFYYTDESEFYTELGYFRTDTPTIEWNVPISYSAYTSDNGKFLVQTTTRDDNQFLTPVQQKFVDYEQGVYDYTTELDPLPTNLGQKFLVRVYFFKDYHILFDNVITTRSVSNIASFSINSEYIENTY
jgi:hypothetical protein